MIGWQNDKHWSDKFLPEIKGILGRALISEAPLCEDRERNTDLMVLTMAPFRIGCRVRKHEYYARYRGQFTIREGRPRSGFKSELSKIIEGWGDFFFYGIAASDDAGFQCWGLGDLRVFRLWFMRELALLDKGHIPGLSRVNGDGSSTFRAFEWNCLPSEFVIDSNGLPERQTTFPPLTSVHAPWDNFTQLP